MSAPVDNTKQTEKPKPALRDLAPKKADQVRGGGFLSGMTGAFGKR